jgi:hypothetical protein
VKSHRLKVVARRLFIEEENRRLKSSCRFAKFRGSLDLRESAGYLTLRQGKYSWSSRIGKSGSASVRIACTSDPRSAIPRFDWNRRFPEGQVARIRSIGDSAVGDSAAKDLESWIPRSAKSRSGRGRVGPRRHSGVQVACKRDIGGSALGKLKGQGSRSEWR